jgi:hypothetical protein
MSRALAAACAGLALLGPRQALAVPPAAVAPPAGNSGTLTPTGTITPAHCAEWEAGTVLEDSGGACGGGGSPGGSSGQLQYNNGGSFGGTSWGKFNVRVNYGAVPDGSTDNTTALANAFTAANAFSGNGTATVYFDCNTGTTTCEYNYGGSGTSPINPTVPMTVECAPGVLLNYTGSAHAADIGATGLTGNPSSEARRYAFRGCGWTGGGSSTAGLYFNTYVTTVSIASNEFISFGTGTTFSIVLPGNNWDYSITDNVWHDLDGTVRGVLDAHAANNANIHFVNNKIDCLSSTGSACAIPSSGSGVGLWIATGYVGFNQILAHYPAIRLSSCQSCGGGAGNFIVFNQLEGNTGGTSPAITYGDPGGTAENVTGWHIDFNNWYWPTTGNISFINEETPASGKFELANSEFIGNFFADTPNSTTPYFNMQGAVYNSAWDNKNANGPVTQSTTTPLFDTGYTANNAYLGVDAHNNNGTSIANNIALGDSTGQHLSAALFHNLGAPLVCSDTSGSGTAQSCNTSPKYNTSGSAVTPVAGDEIIYTTTTTSGSTLTLAVNGGTAESVYKTGNTAAVTTGDIQAGAYYLLVFDGTHWERQF